MNSRLLSAALTVLLVACVGPNFVRPSAPEVTGYTSSPLPRPTVSAEGVKQELHDDQKVVADWWRVFSNRQVNDLVSEALAHNPTIAQAQATLRASEANLHAGYGIFVPEVDGSFGASRQTLDPARLGESSVPNSIYNLFTLSATISYTLDIWGGGRRQIEELRAQAEAQRDSLIATRVILSGNIVNTAIAQAAYAAEIDATEQLVTAERDQVGLTRAQVQAGTVPYANVLTLESQLASTEATLPPLRQKIEQSEHLLAVLTGKFPAEVPPLGLALTDFSVPVDLPLSLPSALVRQRPDILIAESQFHAANADIGVKTAAMLPNITLSASVGANNTNIANLFQPASLFWSLGAGLAGPILDAGTRWFQRQASVETRDAAAANYRQVVLTAFQQVADTLTALEHDAEALDAEAQAAEAASDALKLTQINYQSGVATYLQVLIADEQFQQASIALINARAQRMQDTVALYVALGGGWWNAPQPARTHCARAD